SENEKLKIENSLLKELYKELQDCNCDILNQDVVDQEFLQVFLENGYYPRITSITRPSTTNINKGSCIDNFFIKLSKIKYKTFTLSVPFNDHYPIMISLKGIKNNSSHEEHKKINYNKLRKAAERKTVKIVTYPNTLLQNTYAFVKQEQKVEDDSIIHIKEIKRPIESVFTEIDKM
ncbi:hypothetical protein TSAR_001291, partial [Trichomalopsis sarcophagae]